jgi:thrombospondin type 3 repeat protein
MNKRKLMHNGWFSCWTSNRRVKTPTLLLLLAVAHLARGDGIPEPNLVLYGVITDPSAGGLRVSYGTITWVFQPVAGGPPVVVSGPVTNINDQFSYLLRVPCETQIAGQPVSTGALMLASSPVTYNSQVTILGATASFSQPAQTNLTLLPTDRGRIQQIDLLVSLNGAGLLPPAWQLQYFGHLGVDPFADPDGDGMNNYEEYIAGTNPLDPQSRFQIVRVRRDPGGPFIDWSSVAGKFYTVQRSTSLLDGFADLQTQIPATVPLNTYQDTTGGGSSFYFYRIRVEW